MIHCPKCKADNASDADTCGDCGAHLYVTCRGCGQSNLRSLSKCAECGRRLHRPRWRRWQLHFVVRGKRIGPLEIGGFIIALILVYYYISQAGGPPPMPTE